MPDPAQLVSIQSMPPVVLSPIGGMFDAFGRLRVSTPFTLFSSKMLYDKQAHLWDDQQVSGASTTSTFNTNQSSVTLLADSGVVGRRVRQTFRRFVYQSGKSQLTMMTGCLVKTGAGLAALTRRVGYYDDQNGFFFQIVGSTPSLGLRTYTSGSAVDSLIAQGQGAVAPYAYLGKSSLNQGWNIDNMDGSGPSQVRLDFTQAQLFIIDFQWLSEGSIRFGFDVYGQIYYCHQINIANQQQLVSITNPNLPLRYEIISDGTGVGGVTGSMTQVCSSVHSEAGLEDIGYPFSFDMGATSVTTGNDTNIYALIALQLQSGKFGASLEFDTFSLISTTANATYRLMLILNPTSVAGAALTYGAITNSSFQAAVGVATNLVTGGTVLSSTYVAANKSQSVLGQIERTYSLGSTIAGVSDTLLVAVQPVPASANVTWASINWGEQV